MCGFLDDNQSIEDKAREELREELGITDNDIVSLKRGQVVIDEAPDYKKTWLIVPVLAEVNTDKFTLDWEAQQGEWFTPEGLRKLDFVPNSMTIAKQFFSEVQI